MKPSFAILLILELAFSIWLATLGCWLRNDLLQAMHEVKTHPTSEIARIELEHQLRISELTPFMVGAFVFGSLLLVHAIAAVVRRVVARLIVRSKLCS